MLRESYIKVYVCMYCILFEHIVLRFNTLTFRNYIMTPRERIFFIELRRSIIKVYVCMYCILFDIVVLLFITLTFRKLLYKIS